MRVLIHLGLNTCAAAPIQGALAAAAAKLAGAGVWYPWQAGAAGHFGLSRHYGFGPVSPDVAPVSLGELVAEARLAGAGRLILSSEYLSLYAPRAVRAFAADLAAAEVRAEFVLIRRAAAPWVRALFDQYVRTVDGGRAMADLDTFVGHVLANGAVDIARRVRQWQQVVGTAQVTLYNLPEHAAPEAVLAPFAAFAGTGLARAPDSGRDHCLDADRLCAIGRLRQEHPSPARDAAIAAILAGARPETPPPAGYLDLGDAMRQRLAGEVDRPADGLNWRDLDDAGTAVAA